MRSANTSEDILRNLKEAVSFIQSQLKSKLKPTIGLTLGSGLAGVAAALDVDVAIDFHSIPHFSPSTVEGHPGKLLLGRLSGIPVVVLQGRVHYYEGHRMTDVVFPTRVLGLLGIRLLVLTNASGGLWDTMVPGDLMIIEDHINLTGQNPLVGPNIEELGPRFPDMSEIYSKTHRQLLERIFLEQNVRIHKGVYCGVTGPSYETPAEIRFFQQIGASAVGMSTVAEAIAARHMGLSVVGLSCVTNVAAGLKNSKILSHEDVKNVAHRMEQTMTQAILSFVEKS